jgi:class 3 adenylate cyclase
MDLELALQHRTQVEEFRRKHRTGLVTLLFTDIVGSTQLKQALGDREGAALMQQHRALVREFLSQFQESEEIETAGDSFFIIFVKPSEAVKFSLLLQARLREWAGGSAHAVRLRIGIHIGEVVIEEHEGKSKPRDFYGIQVDACARVMSLGSGDQILLTRSAFDNARQVLKGEELRGLKELQWLNYGLYLLKGLDEPMEICDCPPITPSTRFLTDEALPMFD